MDNWKQLSVATKLNILANESTVMVSLLIGCEPLRPAIKDNKTKEECLAIINENF